MSIFPVNAANSRHLLSAIMLTTLMAGCSSTGNEVAWPWKKSSTSSAQALPVYDPLPTASTTPVTTAPIQTQSFAQNTVSNANAHLVREGDTLYGIAKRNGITTASLMQANGITSTSQLKVGQYLVVPRFSNTAPVQQVVNTQPMPAATTNTNAMPLLLSDTAPRATQPMPAAVATAPVTTASVPQQPLYTSSVPAAGQYRIQPGDTLYSISRRTGVPVNQLAATNGIKNASALKVGSYMSIPAATNTASFASNTNVDPIVTSSVPTTNSYAGKSYRVVKGDTIYAIGRKTGVNPKAIMAKNKLTNPNQLRVGQTLAIPTLSEEKSLVSVYKPVQVAAVTPTTKVVTKPVTPVAAPVTPVTKTTVSAPSNVPVSSGFNWPVKGRIISGFGSKADGSFNNGIDISVPENTEVRAADNGVVAFVGDTLKGYGNLVLLRHNDGWVSAYAHNSKILVKRGDTVTRGQPIALSGKTGAVDTPRLHFELRNQSKAIDPISKLPSA